MPNRRHLWRLGRTAVYLALVSLFVFGFSISRGDEKTNDSIGTAEMSSDGTITLRLIAASTDGKSRGESIFVYKKGDPQYADILKHLGGLQPGKSKSVKPWSDSSPQAIEDKRLKLSVVLMPDSCSCKISIQNISDRDVAVVDGLDRYSVYEKRLPASAKIQFEPGTQGLSKTESEALKKGYTSAIRVSEGVMNPVLTQIGPHKTIEKTFDLKILAAGMVKDLGVDSSKIRKCKIRISFRLYLDSGFGRYIERNSEWMACPECILQR